MGEAERWRRAYDQVCLERDAIIAELDRAYEAGRASLSQNEERGR